MGWREQVGRGRGVMNKVSYLTAMHALISALKSGKFVSFSVFAREFVRSGVVQVIENTGHM